MSGIRWVVVVLLVLGLVGLLAFARGREHLHGDDEGALGARVAVVRVEV